MTKTLHISQRKNKFPDEGMKMNKEKEKMRLIEKSNKRIAKKEEKIDYFGFHLM